MLKRDKEVAAASICGGILLISGINSVKRAREAVFRYCQRHDLIGHFITRPDMDFITAQEVIEKHFGLDFCEIQAQALVMAATERNPLVEMLLVFRPFR